MKYFNEVVNLATLRNKPNHRFLMFLDKKINNKLSIHELKEYKNALNKTKLTVTQLLIKKQEFTINDWWLLVFTPFGIGFCLKSLKNLHSLRRDNYPRFIEEVEILLDRVEKLINEKQTYADIKPGFQITADIKRHRIQNELCEKEEVYIGSNKSGPFKGEVFTGEIIDIN